MKESCATVIIVANSPGEISGWASPVVAGLRALENKITHRLKRIFIVVILPPCAFATGNEAVVAKNIQGVDAIVTPSEYLSFAILGSLPEGLKRFMAGGKGKARQGVVLHLGGDHLHSAIIARRLGFPAIAYSDRTIKFQNRFKKILVEDSRVAKKLGEKGVPDEKISIVGNLMVDSVSGGKIQKNIKDVLGITGDKQVVCLLPGSRKQEIRYVMPFFLRVAEIMDRFCENTEFVIPLSPFVNMDLIQSALIDSSTEIDRYGNKAKNRGAKLEASTGVLSELKGMGKGGLLSTATIKTSGGVQVLVVLGSRYSVMAASDIALCIPGSVTAELGCLGIPTVVSLPLNIPEEIPLTGVFEYIGRLPVIGGPIKRVVLQNVNKRIEFTAIPNKRQRKSIMPEIRGVLTAQDVSIKALELLQDTKTRDRISLELKAAMGRPGAADKVASTVFNMLTMTGGRYFVPTKESG